MSSLYGLAGMLAFPAVLFIASLLTAKVRRIRPGIYCILLGFAALVSGSYLAGGLGYLELGYFLMGNGSADMLLGALLLLAGRDGILLRLL